MCLCFVMCFLNTFSMHANLLHFMMSTMLIFDNYLYYTEILFFKESQRKNLTIIRGKFGLRNDFSTTLNSVFTNVLGDSIFLWLYICFHVHLPIMKHFLFCNGTICSYQLFLPFFQKNNVVLKSTCWIGCCEI